MKRIWFHKMRLREKMLAFSYKMWNRRSDKNEAYRYGHQKRLLWVKNTISSLIHYFNTHSQSSIYFSRWAEERLVGLCFEQFENKISSRSNIRRSPFFDFVCSFFSIPIHDFFPFSQTYIGNILVSVNPFKSLNETYSMEMMTKFKCDELQQTQPHVYAFGSSLHI